MYRADPLHIDNKLVRMRHTVNFSDKGPNSSKSTQQTVPRIREAFNRMGEDNITTRDLPALFSNISLSTSFTSTDSVYNNPQNLHIECQFFNLSNPQITSRNSKFAHEATVLPEEKMMSSSDVSQLYRKVQTDPNLVKVKSKKSTSKRRQARAKLSQAEAELRKTEAPLRPGLGRGFCRQAMSQAGKPSAKVTVEAADGVRVTPNRPQEKPCAVIQPTKWESDKVSDPIIETKCFKGRGRGLLSMQSDVLKGLL